MTSEKNINNDNIKSFTGSCSSICCSSVFTNKTCVLTEIYCVSLYLPRACLVFMAYKGMEHLHIILLSASTQPPERKGFLVLSGGTDK